MKPLLAIALALTLTGCATDRGTMLRGAFVDQAADAYDQSLITAEAWMCRASSVGSVVRAYGSAPDQWAAWLTLCGYSRTSDLDAPEIDQLKAPQ